MDSTVIVKFTSSTNGSKRQKETFKFTDLHVVGGAIPKEYIPAVGEGIEEAIQGRYTWRIPSTGCKALMYTMVLTMKSTLLKWHSTLLVPWHSRMLWQRRNPVLLEPIMKVEVTMPEEYMGDVIGDINSRRGRIEGMEDIGGGKMVKAYVPLC